MKGNKKNLGQSSVSQDILIARLAFVSGCILSLGGALSTIAAGIALEALENSSNQDSQKTDTHSKHSENMQKQIDYLLDELKQIKKIM